jgi:GT2 family glycosyltransferase
VSRTRPTRAVVVTYNAPDELDGCLAAIETSIPVTVVDNSSSDEVKAVAVRHSAEYVDPAANLGFAGGVNLALRDVLSGPAVDILLLNPDAVLRPAALQSLIEYLHGPGHERVAAVSPRLVGADGAEQRAIWPFPTPWRAWADAVGLGRLPARDTYAIGAVLLLRWEALVEIGLFDERFFLYAEEADWQRRALSSGWRSALCVDAVARHAGAATSTDPRRRETLFHAAHETYIRKWAGPRGWAAYRAAACLGAAARAVVLRGERRSAAARRARIYLRGPRRCAGLTSH